MSFRTVWKLPRAIIAGFFANKPFQLAAALSYYTLLSMAPLLLLLTGLAGLFFGEAAAREHVLRYVGTMVGAQEADVVRALMTQAGNHHAGVVSTIIGTAVLVIGATTVFAHLQTALNQIWDVQVAPDRSVILPTSRNQALLYRVSGDLNPLHVDPEAARKAGFQEPILHGLCSYGICQHAVLAEYCGYEPDRISHIEVRFSNVVFPGESLRVDLWRDEDVVSFEATVVERECKAISNGKVILSRDILGGVARGRGELQ